MERLPSKCEALSSNLSTTTKKKSLESQLIQHWPSSRKHVLPQHSLFQRITQECHAWLCVGSSLHSEKRKAETQLAHSSRSCAFTWLCLLRRQPSVAPQARCGPVNCTTIPLWPLFYLPFPIPFPHTYPGHSSLTSLSNPSPYGISFMVTINCHIWQM
jgi:hypothetical protein